MTDPVPADDATLFPKTAGERLREAREAQGLSLEEIAARTRVPLRQLEAIEADNYTGLPSVTYAVGFAKAYARAVGVDEIAIAKEVRSTNDQTVRRTDYEAYEIDDPKRTPGGGLVIGTIVVVVLLLIAIGLWYGTSLFRGTEDASTTPVAESEIMPPAPVAAPTPAAPTSGQVVLTATDEVWMRVYDATGKTLFQNTMKPGDRFEVPSDANGPMINVGRPDKLQVTLNGSALPPLGDGRVAIKDVGVGAAALTARGTGAATPAATAPSTGSSATRTTTGTTSGTSTAPTSGSSSSGSTRSNPVPPAFRSQTSEQPRRQAAPSIPTRTSNTPPAVTINPPATETSSAPATTPNP